MKNNTIVSKSRINIKDLVLTSMLIALVFVATYFIQVPTSINGGLVHTGNVALFMSAIVFGKKKGAIAGGIGMFLFDILSGGQWVFWAPFTLVIRASMGYVIGKVAYMNGKQGKSIFHNLVGILISSIIMIIGYYITEIILHGNWVSPLNSIPGNITQLVIGVVVGVPLSAIIIKTNISSVVGGEY